jgi:hypothetical protein
LTTLEDLASPELIATIQSAAQADPAFATAFFADPKGAYGQRFGSELVPGYDVTVERTSEGAAKFSIPGVRGVFFARLSPTDELSDDELEYISAGAPINCVQGGNK